MAEGVLTPKRPWLAGRFGRKSSWMGVREVKAVAAPDIGYFPAVRVNQRQRISS
jgi:hypothetical protein